MSGNSEFIVVSERGWRRGLANMLNSEMARWWLTKMWWIQCLIWLGTVGFIITMILFAGPSVPPAAEVAAVYAALAGLFPAVGVVIISQGAVVGEKNEGTAAWVLSKPLSRPAFILAKVIANSLGMLVTMIIVPGVVVYVLVYVAAGAAWQLPGFLAGMGMLFLFDFYFLCLTLMLGTLFSSRGPVIGISLALLFLQQNLIGLLPVLRFFLPWGLISPTGSVAESAAPCLIIGGMSCSYSLPPVVALEAILFLFIAILRFNREEL